MTAVHRNTEGAGKKTKGKPGRPKGSKTRPKDTLLPPKIADALFKRLSEQLPEEQFAYYRKVLRGEQGLDTRKELDNLILLLSQQIYPALLLEQMPVEAGGTIAFNKDVTDRIKVLSSLLNLRHQIDKGSDGDKDDANKPLLTIFANRGVDSERLRILVGIEQGPLAGNADGTERPTVQVGTLPNPVPQRQISVQDSEQESSDWILDRDSGRGFGDDGDDAGVSG